MQSTSLKWNPNKSWQMNEKIKFIEQVYSVISEKKFFRILTPFETAIEFGCVL